MCSRSVADCLDSEDPEVPKGLPERKAGSVCCLTIREDERAQHTAYREMRGWRDRKEKRQRDRDMMIEIKKRDREKERRRNRGKER